VREDGPADELDAFVTIGDTVEVVEALSAAEQDRHDRNGGTRTDGDPTNDIQVANMSLGGKSAVRVVMTATAASPTRTPALGDLTC
jgi:hypothetical protein